MLSPSFRIGTFHIRFSPIINPCLVWQQPLADVHLNQLVDGSKIPTDLTAVYNPITVVVAVSGHIEPMITYGTNPGMGMGITQHIPTTEGMGEAARTSFMKSISYMGFQPGEPLLGKKVDYVFLGACTNGRIEDFRAFASIVKGRRKAENVVAWLVPGSWMVDAQIREEGLDKILKEAGFAIRQPGCSACLAMNDDKVPAGKYAVSTSNRNFEGRQGPSSRTLLASPLVAAAAAVTGVITDPRTLI